MNVHTETPNALSRRAAWRFGHAILTLGIAIAWSADSAPASASPLGDAIANFAAARMGKCVDSSLQTRNGPCPTLPQGAVGDGECTDLVQAALKFAGAKPPIFQNPPQRLWYSWGQFVAWHYQRGDIIQFYNTKFVKPDGSWFGTGGPYNGVPGHHTAIIAWSLGTTMGVYEQNAGVRAVTYRVIDLLWRQSGNYVVYRPEYAGPVYSTGGSWNDLRPRKIPLGAFGK
jgi:hypothetical protein